MGILVRKTEDQALDLPFVEIVFHNSSFVYPGDPTQQAAVLRWAITTVQCDKDRVEELTESQLNILTRFLTSFSVIYRYAVPKTHILWDQMAMTSNLCLQSGNTLIYKVGLLVT